MLKLDSTRAVRAPTTRFPSEFRSIHATVYSGKKLYCADRKGDTLPLSSICLVHLDDKSLESSVQKRSGETAAYKTEYHFPYNGEPRLRFEVTDHKGRMCGFHDLNITKLEDDESHQYAGDIDLGGREGISGHLTIEVSLKTEACSVASANTVRAATPTKSSAAPQKTSASAGPQKTSASAGPQKTSAGTTSSLTKAQQESMNMTEVIDHPLLKNWNKSQYSTLNVNVHGIKDVNDPAWVGKIDPYVKIRCGHSEARTQVFNDAGTTVTMNQKLKFPYDSERNLFVEVWDSEVISDRCVGEGKVDMLAYEGKGKSGNIAVPLTNPKGKQEGFVNLALVYDKQTTTQSNTQMMTMGGAIVDDHDTISSHGLRTLKREREFNSVEVVVIDAKDLHNPQWVGSLDPYCKAQLGMSAMRSPTLADAGVNPRIDHAFKFPYNNEKHLRLSVWDREHLGSDDCVGEAKIDLGVLQSKGSSGDLPIVLTIPGKKKNKQRGTLNCRVTFSKDKIEASHAPLGTVGADTQGAMREHAEDNESTSSHGLAKRRKDAGYKGIEVDIIKLEGLKDVATFEDQDPFCKVRVGMTSVTGSIQDDAGTGADINETYVLPYTNEETLRLEVWDHEHTRDNRFISSAKINLNDLGTPENQSLRVALKDKKGKDGGAMTCVVRMKKQTPVCDVYQLGGQPITKKRPAYASAAVGGGSSSAVVASRGGTSSAAPASSAAGPTMVSSSSPQTVSEAPGDKRRKEKVNRAYDQKTRNDKADLSEVYDHELLRLWDDTKYHSLKFNVLRVEDLYNPAWFEKLDPYVKCQLGFCSQKSQVFNDAGTAANINHTFSFPYGGERNLFVEVWDDEVINSDRVLGRAHVDLAEYEKKGKTDKEVKIPLISPKDEQKGWVIGKFTFSEEKIVGAAASPMSYGGTVAQQTESISSHGLRKRKFPSDYKTLEVTVLEAHDLHNPQWLDKLDPYCKVQLGMAAMRSPTLVDAGTDTKINHGFKFPYNNESHLRVSVWDREHLGGDEMVGQAKLDLDKLLDHGKQGVIVVPLTRKGKGQLRGGQLTLDLKFSKNRLAECTHGDVDAKGAMVEAKSRVVAEHDFDDISSHGLAKRKDRSNHKGIEVDVLEVYDLMNLATLEDMDPYVRVRVGMAEIRGDVHNDAGTKATINESYCFPYEGQKNVRIEVWDREHCRTDRFIGAAKLDLDDNKTGQEVKLALSNKKNMKAGIVTANVRMTRSEPEVPAVYPMADRKTRREELKESARGSAAVGTTSSAAVGTSSTAAMGSQSVTVTSTSATRSAGPDEAKKKAKGGAYTAAYEKAKQDRVNMCEVFDHELLKLWELSEFKSFKFFIHSVEELYDPAMFGKIDPYVRVQLGHTFLRTPTFDNAGTSAVINHRFELPFESQRNLFIEVWDAETVTDRVVGVARLDLSEHMSATANVVRIGLINPKGKPQGFINGRLVFSKDYEPATVEKMTMGEHL